jgi:3,2-trans-enoyl-CoA isomerase
VVLRSRVYDLTRPPSHQLISSQDRTVRGVVIGSSVPGIFSAGLNLPELLVGADGTVDALANYWTLVQELFITMYTTPLATVAAIPGHCIAGGCILALSCDARVMVEGRGTMGLNETAFGIVPPPWLSKLLISVCSHRRKAEDMIMRGTLLNTDEAIAAGLVDTAVPLSRLAEEAHVKIGELLAVPDGARAMAKADLRQEAADVLRDTQNEDLNRFIELVTQPAVQTSIAKYLESLGGDKKKKPTAPV